MLFFFSVFYLLEQVVGVWFLWVQKMELFFWGAGVVRRVWEMVMDLVL